MNTAIQFEPKQAEDSVGWFSPLVKALLIRDSELLEKAFGKLFELGIDVRLIDVGRKRSKGYQSEQTTKGGTDNVGMEK
jgi:hypothetical protein